MIYQNAFDRCTGLTTITYPGTVSQCGKISATAEGASWSRIISSTCTIHCTDGEIK